MEWISVDDRLPETHDDVLVFVYDQLGGRSAMTGAYNLISCEWNLNCFSSWADSMDYSLSFWTYEEAKITHWMPLPQPPTD